MHITHHLFSHGFRPSKFQAKGPVTLKRYRQFMKFFKMSTLKMEFKQIPGSLFKAGSLHAVMLTN